MVLQKPNKGDNGYWWRMQNPRSLDDIDELLQNQERLRHSIGLERAKEIADTPQLLNDWEQFRVFHAKARFRSVVTTGAATIGGSILAAEKLGYPSGRALLRARQPFTSIAILGTWVVSYQFWIRVAGWNR